MKVIIGVLFATLLVIGNTQCSIDHRSDGLVCVTKPDCTNGRDCVDGYCVGGSTVDAPRIDAKPIDAKVCPGRCDSCDVGTNTCRIACSTNNCQSKVVCPVGWDCAITCNDANSCNAGVQCSGNQKCDVTCNGSGSCNDVRCGDRKCTVACIGTGSCGQVDCNNACACDVMCAGVGSCGGPLDCAGPNNRCDVLPNGCSSAAPQCNSCQ